MDEENTDVQYQKIMVPIREEQTVTKFKTEARNRQKYFNGKRKKMRTSSSFIKGSEVIDLKQCIKDKKQEEMNIPNHERSENRL